MQAGIMSWYVFDGVVRRVKGIKKAKLLQDRSPHCIHVPQRKLTRWVAGFWRSCFTVALTMIHLTDHSNDRVISANVTCSSALGFVCLSLGLFSVIPVCCALSFGISTDGVAQERDAGDD